MYKMEKYIMIFVLNLSGNFLSIFSLLNFFHLLFYLFYNKMEQNKNLNNYINWKIKFTSMWFLTRKWKTNTED